MDRILVVEDDRELNQGICFALQQAGYETESAYSTQEAKLAGLQQEYSLMILDVNLPDGEGFGFCKWIMEHRKVKVMFLTARDLEEDVLSGYELGAEDYVTKPFSIHILLKKIAVILKRETENPRNIYEDGYLRIDFDRVKVEIEGKECMVTPAEFRMLRLFIEHAGQLLSYNVLLEQLWDCDEAYVDRHTLAVNVNRLRGKIEDAEHKYISNVYGMGYQWLR